MLTAIPSTLCDGYTRRYVFCSSQLSHQAVFYVYNNFMAMILIQAL